MKILIVDDELLVRIGIKSCINWHEHGMEIVGEASDGIGALELLRSLQPDVMFLDIKMPNMDGIELLRKIQEEKIKCKVLILSGFDDVYHVKEAMRYGAADYFHKPCMSPKDILDTLLEIKRQLVHENTLFKNNSFESDSVQRNKSILKEVFLKELVEGRITDPESFKIRNSEVGSRLQDKNFSCIVFYIKHMEEVQKRYVNTSNSVQNAVLNVIGGVLSREAGVEFFASDKNLYVTIASFADIISEKKALERINCLVELIIDAAKQFLNVEIVIGVGDLYKSCKEIKNTFDEAIKAVKYRFFKKTGDVIHYRDTKHSNNKEALIYVDSVIGKMKNSLEKREYATFQHTLDTFTGFLEEQPVLTEEDVKKLFNAFLFVISEGKSYFDKIELFNSCIYLRQMQNIWLDILEQKQQLNKTSIDLSKCSYLIKNIISYIDKNYSQEITLNLLSKNFNVSPNYISRLFREETGENLFNYINEVRVEKAKKLLRETDQKIYEVSNNVGFKSPVHFNIVFNKYTGLTPKQYRDEAS